MIVSLADLSVTICEVQDVGKNNPTILTLLALVAIAERLEGLTDELRQISNMIQKGK